MLEVITGKFRVLVVITGEFCMLAVMTGKIRMVAVITGEFCMLAVMTGEFHKLELIESLITLDCNRFKKSIT